MIAVQLPLTSLSDDVAATKRAIARITTDALAVFEGMSHAHVLYLKNDGSRLPPAPQSQVRIRGDASAVYEVATEVATP